MERGTSSLFGAGLLRLECVHQSPGQLEKVQALTHTGEGPGFSISYKLPGDTKAAVHGPHSSEFFSV